MSFRFRDTGRLTTTYSRGGPSRPRQNWTSKNSFFERTSPRFPVVVALSGVPTPTSYSLTRENPDSLVVRRSGECFGTCDPRDKRTCDLSIVRYVCGKGISLVWGIMSRNRITSVQVETNKSTVPKVKVPIFFIMNLYSVVWWSTMASQLTQVAPHQTTATLVRCGHWRRPSVGESSPSQSYSPTSEL